MKMSMSMLCLFTLFFLGVLSLANGIEDKCVACKAVAEELEHGLSNERPRNHLDMRHRLDSKGQRKGKVIDYRVSELRVVELLDGLCEKMQDYTLKKIDSNKYEWFKVSSWDNLTINKQEARAYSKDISSYCGRLLEQTEDELAELIKNGSVKVGDVSKVLCQDLSKHCNQISLSKLTQKLFPIKMVLMKKFLN
ncbi:protein canopy-1 [Senna tora]|uniref:Protein canopy-1 n=1 Tax=Senna tora TaxID=362788 RepID=A0A834TAD7_9FABA|nr:protein canopy-1 [Senna tora]